MGALRAAAPRLAARPSNGNIREGFATIASPARRAPAGGLGGLFGPGDAPPPVPLLPPSVTTPGAESPTIVRQPRGPGALGFVQRQNSRGPEAPKVATPGAGLDTRSHEPLEI
jgi:hypothetical protein